MSFLMRRAVLAWLIFGCGGISSSWAATATLVSITVTPSTASVAAGAKQQFSATGTYSNGSQKNITQSVTWSSMNASVATVTSAGLAKGVAVGSVSIKASSESISQTATLQVTPAVLSSITVTPANASLVAGITRQFVATGKYSDGSTAVITNSVSWVSSLTSVATIGNAGLVQAIAAGQATISASSGGVTGQTGLTVTAPTLVTIAVSPASPSTSVGLKVQFMATGTYSDGSTNNVTSSVTWRSSNTAVATISTGGLATPIATGSANITATLSRISGTTTLKVTARTLQSIAVTPANSSIPLGTTEQLTATGTYSDGSTQNLTSTVTWASTSTSIASVDSKGLATGHGIGGATITATSGGLSGQTGLTVSSAVLMSISVTSGGASIPLGTNEQFTATGTFTDGTTQNLSALVSWTSSAPSIAIIGATGLATSETTGVANISASSGSIQSNAVSLTVLPAVLESIAVTPSNPSIAAGTTKQFAATGTYSDGSTQDISASVTWSSDTSTVAVISTAGLATSIAIGNANISAASGSISGSTSLTVVPASLVSIAVTPAIPSIPLGTTLQFKATGTYTDNSIQDLTTIAQWSSSNATAATIGNSAGSYGLAASSGVGSTTISATVNAVSGSTTLSVNPAELEMITVGPSNPSIQNGASQQFTATGTYSDSTIMDLTSTAAWSSDTPSVATIDSTGLSQGVGIGTAGITATVGTASGTTSLTVTAAALVSITVSPSSISIPLGTTQGFSAMGNYADGSQRDLSSSVHWSTSDSTVATVSNAGGTFGVVTSVALGSVTVTATLGSISGTGTLSVTAATLVSIIVAPVNPTIALGNSQQFTATGTYSDGTTKDITTNVTWTSSSALVAVASNNTGSQGLVASSGVGSATISAAMDAVSGGTLLTVGPPQLLSIAVTPEDPSISRGTSLQFTAMGTYSNGSTANLTSSVIWSSSDGTVATISAGGSATGVNSGTTTITATLGSIAGSTPSTVIAPTLTGLIINPVNPSITIGATEQFSVTAVFSDASSQDVTSVATWTSSSPTIATISSSALATAVNYGTTSITAQFTGLIAMTTLSVQAPGLVNVTIPVDVAVPMNIADVNGTPITTTMLNNGTIASDCAVGGTGSGTCSWTKAGSAFTVAPSQSGCANPGLVAINEGFTYGAGSWNDHAMAFDATQILNTSQFPIPVGNVQNVSMLFCAVMGMSRSSSVNLFDMFVMEDAGGFYAVAPQLETSCGGIGGNFAVNIEGKSKTGATVHSACIPVTQGATYWFAANYNTSLGTAALSVYSTAGTLVGSVALSNLERGNAIMDVRIGNNELGNFTGTVYFQNLMLDWTNHAVPLFW